MNSFLFALAAWLFPLQVSGMTTFTVGVAGPFVTGQTPTSITFTIQPDVAAITGTLTITFDGSAQIFDNTDGATTAYTLVDSGSSTLASTAAFSGSGNQMVVTMNAASIPTGSDSVLTVTGLAALPAAGAITCGVSDSNGNTALTTQAVMTVVAAPTIGSFPLTAVGDQPTSLEISITLPVVTAATQTLTITPSATIFTGSATSDVTIDGAVGNAMAGSPTVSAFTTSAITVTSGGASAVGEVLKLTVAQAGLATLPSPTGAVTFDVVHSVSTNTLVNDAALFTITAGAAGNDPIARWGNVVRKFELQPGTMTLLVQTPQIQVFGSVFEGGGPWEQWFDHYVLTDIQQTRFMDIKMKKNLLTYNHSTARRGAFKTMDVSMGYGSFLKPLLTTEIGMDTPIPEHFLGSQIVMRNIQRFHTTKATSFGKFPRECADVAAAWLHFYICSSPATEYYGNFRHFALLYAHLDMAVMEIMDHTKLTGLFPELWGLQPMSETTKALVTEDMSTSTAGVEEAADVMVDVNKTDLNDTVTATKALGLCAEPSKCQKMIGEFAV